MEMLNFRAGCSTADDSLTLQCPPVGAVTPRKCVEITQLCDGRVDCPGAPDEDDFLCEVITMLQRPMTVRLAAICNWLEKLRWMLRMSCGGASKRRSLQTLERK